MRRGRHGGLQKYLQVASCGSAPALTTDLGSEDGEDELAGVEGVEDVGDDAEVGRCGDVGLEADVAELGLGRDVDGDVLPQTIVLLLLTIIVITPLTYSILILNGCSQVLVHDP